MKRVQNIQELAIGVTAPDEAGVSVGCTLIQAGMNAVGGRYWPEQFLQDNVKRFDGSFCHIDHPSRATTKENPEGKLSTLAARVSDPRWDATKRAVVGDLHFLPNQNGQQMKATFADGVIRERAGLSVRWPGQCDIKTREIDGRKVQVPVRLLEGKGFGSQFDVDFVLRPTAGGKVGTIQESEVEIMSELAEVTLEQLEGSRPDLVEAAGAKWAASKAEKETKESDVKKKEEEKAEEEKKEEETSVDNSGLPEAAQAELEKMRQQLRRSTAKGVLIETLSASNLPDKAKALVESAFTGAECDEDKAEDFKKQVDAKVTDIQEVMTEAGAGRPRGLGGIPTSTDADTKRTDRVRAGINLAAGVKEEKKPDDKPDDKKE